MAEGKNTHLEHLEDEIINKGYKGGVQAIKILEEMGKLLSGTGGNINVTTKWDGAPAIICGTDPSDNKFFVGTKSVFAKTNPKMAKSENEVMRLGYEGVLAQKLKLAYRYLSKADIKGVLQGDLMFTDDKSRATIDGDRYLIFRPNTITYAVDPNSDLGKDIDKARLGIVFHTKYTGPNLQSMVASFNVTDSDFRETPFTWIQKAEFKDAGGVASLRTDERTKYNLAINRARGSLQKCRKLLGDIQSGKKTLQIDTEYKKFFNNYVKAGDNIPSVKKAYVDFAHHMGREYDKIIQKNKTLKAQAEKAGKFIAMVDLYVERQAEFEMIIATYMNLQFCKHILVEKMKKVSQLRLFVDKGGGDYEATTPEGFVAISGRTAVKLIDRLEFSRLNFTIPKNW